jgi:uncharacterized membrane protein
MEASLLSFSQASGILAFMNTPWGWPFVETLHFLGLSLLIGTVGLFDLRLLGLAQHISIHSLHKLVPWGVVGYLMNLITGIMFVSSAPDQYLHNPAFISKLSFMGVAGINMILFYLISWPAGTLDSELRLRHARTGAAVSLFCWLGVIVCGRLITFFRPPWCWFCG